MAQATTMSGRRLLLIAVAALGLMLVPSIAGTDSYWFESYERAARLIDAGNFDESARILDMLIQEHPAPVASLRVPGDRYIDYLPYYQRARILLQRGDTLAASHNLDICEAFGAIQQSRRTESDLKTLREQIARTESARAGQPKPAVAAIGAVKK